MIEMTIWGRRIKDRRKALGLNQGDLADAIAVTQAAVSRYESGENNPTADVLIELAQVLKTSTDWLLGRTNNPDQLVSESLDLTLFEREALNLLRTNPVEDQAVMLAIWRDLDGYRHG